MVKINNTFKACALFAGVLYLLYGGRLVNEWRAGGLYAPSSGGRATAEYHPSGLAARAPFANIPVMPQTGGGGGAYGLGGGGSLFGD